MIHHVRGLSGLALLSIAKSLILIGMRFLLKATIKPGTDKAEVMSRLPAANAVDAERVKQGVQEGPALVAADRSAGWLILNCESEEELRELCNQMPLNEFQDYEITHLLAAEDN